MKIHSFLFLFVFIFQYSNGQDFITKWKFTASGNTLSFHALTTDTVHYSWSTSPSGNSGTGNFIQITPGQVVLQGLEIDAGDIVTLEMAPNHLKRFFMEGNFDRNKLHEVRQWGIVEWSSMEKAFWGCENLIFTATDTPDLTQVTSMRQMFYSASSFNQDISYWDVSNIEDMSAIFAFASAFDQNINQWDVSSVTNMSGLFSGASTFNQELSNWDVSNVTHMEVMFLRAHTFDQDISSWNVSNVTNMEGMFSIASSFNQKLNNWDVSNVTDMSRMFSGASSFNQDIDNWDVSNVKNMKLMFSIASSFNQDLQNWDVSSVDSLTDMFNRATSFNQNIGSWTFSPFADLRRMLNSSGLDCDHYSATLVGWQENNPSLNDVTLGAMALTFGTGAVTARNILINNQGWTINGDEPSGMACDGTVNTFEPNDGSNNYNIYPNPTIGQITLRGGFKNPETIYIYSSSAQNVTDLVEITQFSTSKISMDLSPLNQGLYIIQTSSDIFAVYKL